jgi:hypothetical protein
MRETRRRVKVIKIYAHWVRSINYLCTQKWYRQTEEVGMNPRPVLRIIPAARFT